MTEEGSGVFWSAKKALDVAVAYWPGRWSKATVLAAEAFVPFAAGMAPPDWTTVLDRLSLVVDPAIPRVQRRGKHRPKA